MSRRDDIVAAAVAEIGYKEGRNNDNKFGLLYGANNVAWCGYFTSVCADKANIPAEAFPRGGYVPTLADWFISRERFYKRGTYTPRPGDLIFFDFNRNGNSDHIGLVEKVVGNIVYTIEGNTTKTGESGAGGGVWRKSRAMSNLYIRGYGVPAYEEDKVKTQKITVLMNGQMTPLTSIIYEDENYIRLRDLADADQGDKLTVDWDAGSKTVIIKSK